MLSKEEFLLFLFFKKLRYFFFQSPQKVLIHFINMPGKIAYQSSQLFTLTSVYNQKRSVKFRQKLGSVILQVFMNENETAIYK